MKQLFTIALVASLCGIFANVNAQQINITADPFQYKFEDRSYNGSNHTYVAWALLANHDRTMLCSTVYNMGTVYPSTVYTCPQHYFPGMLIDLDGYLVGILIVRDNDPFGSGLNRGGYSGPLFPDIYNKVYPSNISIAGW